MFFKYCNELIMIWASNWQVWANGPKSNVVTKLSFDPSNFFDVNLLSHEPPVYDSDLPYTPAVYDFKTTLLKVDISSTFND